jgi:hypothetical protein
MTTQSDDRMRELVLTALGDPPSDVTVDGIRRRVMRRSRTRRASLVAAAIVIAALALVPLVMTGGARGRLSVSPTPPPPIYLRVVANGRDAALGTTTIARRGVVRLVLTVRIPGTAHVYDVYLGLSSGNWGVTGGAPKGFRELLKHWHAWPPGNRQFTVTWRVGAESGTSALVLVYSDGGASVARQLARFAIR